jgi:hypothetical protein
MRGMAVAIRYAQQNNLHHSGRTSSSDVSSDDDERKVKIKGIVYPTLQEKVA